MRDFKKYGVVVSIPLLMGAGYAAETIENTRNEPYRDSSGRIYDVYSSFDQEAKKIEKKDISDYSMLMPQLIMVTLGVSNVEKVSQFYSGVFGFPFVPSFSENGNACHAKVSSGSCLGINQKYGFSKEPDCVLHFSVSDIKEYEGRVLEKGGKKMFPWQKGTYESLKVSEEGLKRVRASYEELTGLSPDIITNSLGDFATFSDCEGSLFSLIQLEPWARPYYSRGKLTDFDYREIQLAQEQALRAPQNQ